MVKTALGKNQDKSIPTVDAILRIVTGFHKQLARIKNKDINSYKELIDLKDVVDEAEKAAEEKKIAKQAKKVFENDEAVIYAPFTVQASCKYGAGSRWCISGTAGTNNSNPHFDDYSKHSNFYFFINKKMNARDNRRDYKYALQWRFDGRGGRDMTWWDAQDDSHPNPPSWVTDDMMRAVEAFNPKHKAIKLGAQAKAFLENPNIRDYSKFRDIIKPEEKMIAKQAKKVFENDEAVIYAPFTVQASCKYGAGSRWCISGTAGTNNSNPHFDDYSKHSNFYFFINKKMNARDNRRDYKYALQWRFDGRGGRDMTWWDAQDDSHPNPPSWVTDDMMRAVEAFNPKHKAIKLGAQAKAFLENPNIRDYSKFRDIIKPEEKMMVIDKIISNTNLNSSTFATLAPDLTDEQKSEFITNYVKGKVNVSDYKKMKDHLSTNLKITLVTYNPTILNNYDVMNDMNSEFSDEDKYNLSKVIDAKQINNKTTR